MRLFEAIGKDTALRVRKDGNWSWKLDTYENIALEYFGEPVVPSSWADFKTLLRLFGVEDRKDLWDLGRWVSGRATSGPSRPRKFGEIKKQIYHSNEFFIRDGNEMVVQLENLSVSDQVVYVTTDDKNSLNSCSIMSITELYDDYTDVDMEDIPEMSFQEMMGKFSDDKWFSVPQPGSFTPGKFSLVINLEILKR